MLDNKAMSFMPGGPEKNLRQFGAKARHLHLNDSKGYGPGMSDFDYVPVLRAAKQAGYTGWVSAEPFDYSPDPDTVACRTIETLRAAVEMLK